MKKIAFALLLLGLFVPSVFAIPSGFLPYGVGARFAGMGGAGSALCDDITSAYFNPAGIVDSGRVDVKLGAGVATQGMNDLINVVSQANDPAKFFSSNFNKAININGNFNALLGFSANKIGLSVIPVGNLYINKPAAGLVGSIGAAAFTDIAATMGYGFSTPGLPFGKLNFGASVKSANQIMASSIANGGTSTSSDQVINYSGIGFDVGAKAVFDTMVIPFSVALVMKDLGETLSGTVQNVTTTYDNQGNITNQTKTQGNAPSYTSATTMVIGAATKIPGVGLKVAADLDSVSGAGLSYSVTHLGVEYPIVGIVALRAGYISGGQNGSISQTTIGAGFNFFASANIALMMDGKDSKNNSTIFDLGFAL